MTILSKTWEPFETDFHSVAGRVIEDTMDYLIFETPRYARLVLRYYYQTQTYSFSDEEIGGESAGRLTLDQVFPVFTSIARGEF